MKVIQSTDNFSRIEESGGVVESSCTSKIAEKLPTTYIREQHVKEALVLGTPTEVHKERMVYLLRNKNNLVGKYFKFEKFRKYLYSETIIFYIILYDRLEITL